MFEKLFSMLSGGASSASRPAPAAWVEGALYVTPQDNGGFAPLKLLKVDEHGIHVRTYSNVYPAIPAAIDEATLYMAGMDRAAGEPLGMGHLPVSRQSFVSWGAVFVQQSSVAEAELEGYQMWLEAEGGYF